MSRALILKSSFLLTEIEMASLSNRKFGEKSGSLGRKWHLFSTPGAPFLGSNSALAAKMLLVTLGATTSSQEGAPSASTSANFSASANS